MKNSLLSRIWAWIKWPLMALLLLFIVACVYFINKGGELVRTREAVAKIHATRLTHNDVFGPVVAAPDPVENDKTLAGVDANNNGIRDDVELAIYHAHQNSAKVTAAELQYAKELQLQLTSVNNKETFVAAIQEDGRGDLCIASLSSDLKTADSRSREVESFIFSTPNRKVKYEDNYKRYMVGYASLNGEDCDLDFLTFPN